MTVAQVKHQMAGYEEKVRPPTESGWGFQGHQIQPSAFAGWYETALRGPRTHQGFTGQLSYNHYDYDHVSGSYIISVVDDRVVDVSIYDD